MAHADTLGKDPGLRGQNDERVFHQMGRHPLRGIIRYQWPMPIRPSASRRIERGLALPTLPGLLRASHPGPTVAVTALTALLALAVGHELRTGLVVTGAVAAGQLTIGWSNDLIDAGRDQQVGRADKPVARGEVSEALVRGAIAVAAGCCLVLSLASGLASAAVHLLLVVGSGWAYNVGLKRVVWSWVPYAIAFGALPAVITLALPDPQWPPVWMMAAGALLGVGAHLLNALPDLAEDAQTGVQGLPHRLGRRTLRWLAPLVLTVASAVAASRSGTGAWVWAAFGLCVVLAAIAVRGRGRVPFAAAVCIAMVDVVSLVVQGSA
jgi:4-hydroxybenzoate polyprenyltransferase